MTKQTTYSILFLIATVLFAIAYANIAPARGPAKKVEPTPYFFIVPQM